MNLEIHEKWMNAMNFTQKQESYTTILCYDIIISLWSGEYQDLYLDDMIDLQPMYYHPFMELIENTLQDSYSNVVSWFLFIRNRPISNLVYLITQFPDWLHIGYIKNKLYSEIDKVKNEFIEHQQNKI